MSNNTPETYLLISTPPSCIKSNRLNRDEYRMIIEDYSGQTSFSMVDGDSNWDKMQIDPFKACFLLRIDCSYTFEVENHPYLSLQDVFKSFKTSAELEDKVIQIEIKLPRAKHYLHMKSCKYSRSHKKATGKPRCHCLENIHLLNAREPKFHAKVLCGGNEKLSIEQLNTADRYYVSGSFKTSYVRTVAIPSMQPINQPFVKKSPRVATTLNEKM